MHIANMESMSKEALEKSLDFKFRKKNLLITFHPETLNENSVEKYFDELLQALDRLGKDVGLIFTGTNSDTFGHIITAKTNAFLKNHSNAIYHASLGQMRYLNTIRYVDVVVGNSSSGLCEVPSFKKPTVNIGDRQKGRLRTKSVIDCDLLADDILKAIEQAQSMDCSCVVNPNDYGDSAKQIITILKQHGDCKQLIKKHFFDIGGC